MSGTHTAGRTPNGGRLLFGELFYALRRLGVPASIHEWFALMQALEQGLIAPSLEAFYHAGRALLVKNEALFDLWDQIFLALFGDAELPTGLARKLLAWLENPRPLRELDPESLAALERLGLDRLRELFEQRLREQTERHDGGSKWIGTGGTSPFGHSGYHPGGIRVGGSGRNRSAAQIAGERRFRDYRADRVLDVRAMAAALKKLRRLGQDEGEPELDVERSIDATCRKAGELELVFTPPRKNQAKVLLLMDTGGSMTPFTSVVERLFSAASQLDHWKRFEAYHFHNCVYDWLHPSFESEPPVSTAALLREHDPETFLIVVGDASMAPSELTERWGAIDYAQRNETPGLVWLHRLRKRWPYAVWLNPLPPRWWRGWTIGVIASLFPMFPLTVAGLEDAVDLLRRRRRLPLPDIGTWL
ncbi:MAG: VWA domain-containing protein [Planctomycetota bacterium]|nr:MAG: VWA domain-containing protein [Planctomycetota bacterium]